MSSSLHALRRKVSLNATACLARGDREPHQEQPNVVEGVESQGSYRFKHVPPPAPPEPKPLDVLLPSKLPPVLPAPKVELLVDPKPR